MRLRLCWLRFLWIVGRADGAVAIDWPTVEFEDVATELNDPSSLTHAGDGSGRLFVTEQAGNVRIIKGTNLVAEPLLAITDRVAFGVTQVWNRA